MLTDYGVPLLLRFHAYLSRWVALLADEDDTPAETSLQELRCNCSVRAMVLP